MSHISQLSMTSITALVIAASASTAHAAFLPVSVLRPTISVPRPTINVPRPTISVPKVTLARMLAALTSLEMAVGRSRRAKEAVPPRYAPPAGAFLEELAKMDSAELRIAAGIASCATQAAEGRPARSMRQILLPVDPGGWRDAPLVPGWSDVPLGDLLTSRFGVPVLADSHANLAAIGERWQRRHIRHIRWW